MTTIGGPDELKILPSLSLSLDQLSGCGDLSGVVIIEEEGVWLARARREVESQAKKMLMQGLELMVNTHTITAHTHAHITPSHHHLCMYVHYVLTYTDTHTFLLIIRTRAKWVWLCRCFTTSPSSPPHSSPSSLPTRKPYNTTFRMPSTHPPWFKPAMVGFTVEPL